MTRNHDRLYRPLRGGTIVFNPNVGVLGTLGLIATSDGIDRWLISCYHVLGRANGAPFADNEPVTQGDLVTPIARLRSARADSALDCIAAEVDPGVACVRDILGLPPVTQVGQPMVGMRVVKSGRETGVTEGLVEAINGNEVVIGLVPTFPRDYELSGVGDSGAVWIEPTSGAAMALHRAGNSATRKAFAASFPAVLTSLGLNLLA